MVPLSDFDSQQAMAGIRAQVETESVRVTQHAHEEMVAEEITLQEVFEALARGEILENYPEHRRGPCCLVSGFTGRGRPLHVVCTTAQPLLIVITVYEPKPPQWTSPTRRGGKGNAV